MSTRTRNPLRSFQDRLLSFALGERRGIRNPFVVVPVAPPLEWKVTVVLEQWADTEEEVEILPVRMDRLLPETPVFRTVEQLPPEAYPDRSREPTNLIQRTLRENLHRELIDVLLDERPHLRESTPESALLLLRLGALYPFARASELLDELDRRGVRLAVGVPFPGQMVAGKLSFFGEDATHYYPAHQIAGQVGAAELQL